MKKELYIKRDGKEWTVTAPIGALSNADSVSWEFQVGPNEPDDLEARFQFTDNQFVVPGNLTKDWTSKKPLKKGETLEVQITKPPPRKGSTVPFTREFHYAVMISGTDLDGGASGKVQLMWARGTNPPPKVDVGGG